MYRIVESTPASPTGTANTTKSAGSCTPNLLLPEARSDDEKFGISLRGYEDEVINTTSTTGIFGRGARRQDNDRLVTVFLVVNFILGSGILNMPQTFRDSGLAATTVLYIVACESCCCECFSRPGLLFASEMKFMLTADWYQVP